MVACLCLSTVGLTAEVGSVAGLRERVVVLDQARDKAAAELTVKEQQGSVSNRDQEHYRTVTAFLDQQIAESCTLLVSKGGATATEGLPCPRKATALKKVEEKKPATTSGDQTLGKQHEKVVAPEEQLSPVSVLPPEAVQVNKEKVEGAGVPPQQPPATGVFAAIRRWWESLFAPKPPPVATGSETGHPPKQNQNSAVEEENKQRSGDSSTQQAVQNPAAENSDAAGGTGNHGLSDNSTGAQKTVSGEKGVGQKQEQQQKNGDEQAAPDAEESRHQAGHEQVTENDAKGSEAAGQEENKSGNTAVSVGSGTTKQNGTQSGSSVDAIGKAGAARKVAEQEGGGSGEQENQEGVALSGTSERRTVDVGKGGKAQKGTGQKDGAGQQAPAQPAGQSMADTRKKQPGSVGSGPEEKNTGRLQKQGSGSIPVADTEVAKLEKSLSDAMDEFDGKLLSEQERLAARIPKQREGSTAGSGGYGAEGPLGPAGGGGIAGGGYEGSGEQGGDSRAGAAGSGQPGSVAAGGGKPAPSADGRSTIGTDDDIVARQLREAAEKETDPVLKEKLWQEYRKYKQGGG